MKIGTITYHRADNYGAVLQAYALFAYIKSLGHDVFIIDYWPKYHQYVYRLWTWDSSFFKSIGIKVKMKYIISYIFKTTRKFTRIKRFQRFRKEHLRITPMDDTLYDAVFYGSDIIWSRWSLNSKFCGFDSVYWGDNTIKSKCKFSYAASMGNVLDTPETKKWCTEHLSAFEKISVRESQLKKKLSLWGINNVELLADPTILLSKQEWEDVIGNNKINFSYILCYNLERSPIVSKIAEELSKKYKLRIIELTADVYSSIHKVSNETAGPKEFLTYFHDASFVVTSSYHGVIFSLIFNKKFVFNSHVQVERIESLLDVCKIPQAYVKEVDLPIIENGYDYFFVNQTLNHYSLAAKQFIQDCLYKASCK